MTELKKKVHNLTMFFLQGKLPFIRYINDDISIKENFQLEKKALKKHDKLTIKGGKIFIIEEDVQDPEWFDLINHLKKGNNKISLLKRHNWTTLIFIRFEEIHSTIALTYGRTSGILNNEYIISDFGRDVSRQIVNSKDLNHINIKSFDDRQTRIHKYSIKSLNENQLLEPFKLNTVFSFLGNAYIDNFRVNVGGTDSLKIKGNFNLEKDLLYLIYLINDSYQNKEEKEPSFKVEGNIEFIDDSKLERKLNNYLNEKLELIFNSPKIDGTTMRNLYINPTKNINQDEFMGYNFSSIKIPKWVIISEDELNDIDIFEKIKLTLNEKNISAILNKLKNIKVHLISEEPTQNEEVSFYKSLYFEKTFQGIDYILSDGKWYGIDSNYYERISEQIDQIDTTNVIDYIKYDNISKNKHTSENKYNEDLAKRLKILELDATKYSPTKEVRDYAQVSPNSNIELADLFNYDPETQTIQFIHVKKLKGGPAHIIHVFTQAKTSAQIYAFDKKNVIDFINKKRKESDLKQINFSEIKNTEIVISLIIPENKKDYTNPSRKLFTILERVSLYETVNILSPLGFKIKLNFIDSNLK